MALPVREGLFIAPPPTFQSLEEVSRFLSELSTQLHNQISEMARSMNDDVLVGPDQVQIVTGAYTVQQSDRALLLVPSGAFTLTLPDPDDIPPMEPRVLWIRHAAALHTVTVDPAGSVTIDGAATLAMTSGMMRGVVPLRTETTYRAGAGTAGWYSVARYP